jgi:hypothetical protein
MPKKVRARSVKALLKVTNNQKDKQQSKCSCISRNNDDHKLPVTTLTPELEKASNEGLNFIKEVAFPSIPAILQDLWVYLELIISIVAFCLGIRGQFPIEGNFIFQYSYFTLTIVSMILALIDAYIYFIEVGSCARAIRYYKKKVYNNSEIEDEDHDQQQKKTCCKQEVKEKLHMFFEVGRNVVTELLLYPILIFDLFSFVSEQTYNPGDIFDRLDYSLFIVGSFYLVLAVYIMRFLVVFGSIQSLLRLPVNDKSSSSSLLLRFCFHACGQILVHLMIILVVGAKINNENAMIENNTVLFSNTSDESDPNITASPFLWVSIILGWLLPLAGTTAFFIINYYWLREFSIDFWLNMISLLQGASFADSVFGGEGVSETKEKTLEFVDKSNYVEVKLHFVKYKSPHWTTKFFYPAKVPVAAICCLLYDFCLIVFIGSLILTYNDEKIIIAILGDDTLFTYIFFIAVIVILIANLHILILLNSVLIVLLLIIAGVTFTAIFIILPVLLFIYIPIVGLLGYSLLLKQLFTSSKNRDHSHISLENFNYD